MALQTAPWKGEGGRGRGAGGTHTHPPPPQSRLCQLSGRHWSSYSKKSISRHCTGYTCYSTKFPRNLQVLYMYQLFLDECAAHMPPPPSSERTWRGSAVVQSSGAASASSSARSRGAVARWALPPLLRAPMGSGKVSISKKS